MKLDYTTDYVWEDEHGTPYNIEIETTFDVTPGRPTSFEHPPEGPEINDLTVTVLHIEGVVDTDDHYEKIATAIADELWENIRMGIETDLIKRVYDDADEAMWDHA